MKARLVVQIVNSNTEPKKIRPYILGIDPGKQGAFAIIDYTNKPIDCVCLVDLPFSECSSINTKSELNSHDFSTLLDVYKDKIAFAVVEKVAAMTYTDSRGQKRGQGAAASFAFGKSYGMLLGVLHTFQIPVVDVQPSVWKILLGLNSQKKNSIDLAKTLYPQKNVTEKLTRKKDDGRAEALLLAHFGLRFLKGEK